MKNKLTVLLLAALVSISLVSGGKMEKERKPEYILSKKLFRMKTDGIKYSAVERAGKILVVITSDNRKTVSVVKNHIYKTAGSPKKNQQGKVMQELMTMQGIGVFVTYLFNGVKIELITGKRDSGKIFSGFSVFRKRNRMHTSRQGE